MVVEEYLVLFHVKLGSGDLPLLITFRIQRVLLRHFADIDVLVDMVILELEQGLDVAIFKSHTSVHESVFSVLIPLKRLDANVFLTVDEAILVPMVVEIELPVLSIYLDKLFPVKTDC